MPFTPLFIASGLTRKAFLPDRPYRKIRAVWVPEGSLTTGNGSIIISGWNSQLLVESQRTPYPTTGGLVGLASARWAGAASQYGVGSFTLQEAVGNWRDAKLIEVHLVDVSSAGGFIFIDHD